MGGWALLFWPRQWQDPLQYNKMRVLGVGRWVIDTITEKERGKAAQKAPNY